MNQQLFTPQELIVFEATFQKIVREANRVALLRGLALLQAFGLLMVVVVEYSLLYEVFDYLKGPASGSDADWSVGLLALTGTIMLLAFHLYARERNDAPAVRIINRCVDFLLPLYVLGAGAALAAIIYFNGADALIASVAESGRELFSEGGAASGNRMFERILSFAPAAFALGCSGLAVINLFASHRLASLLWSNVKDIEKRAAAATDARAAMSDIHLCLRQHAQLLSERDDISSVDQNAEDIADANRILGVIRHEIVPYETWLTDQKVRGREPDSPFVKSQTSLDVKEMQHRVAAIKAMTVKSILSAMRGTKE